MKIINGIHQIKIPIPDNPLEYLNSYLIEGSDGWLMVDTGWSSPDAFTELENQLKNLGLTFTDIAHVVLTHSHPDHSGMANKIKRLSQATLYLHQMENIHQESWKKKDKTSDYSSFTAGQLRLGGMSETEIHHVIEGIPTGDNDHFIISHDIALEGSEIISTGLFNFKVIWTPGHSPGHICLYEPEKKILFSGDHVLPIITPNISQFSPRINKNPLVQFLSSLRNIEHLDVDIVLPAHEHIFKDLKKRIGEIIHHHEQRLTAILDTEMEKPKTVYQVASNIPWMVEMKDSKETKGTHFQDLPLLHKALAMGETAAHLELLRKENKVKVIFRDNTAFYECN